MSSIIDRIESKTVARAFLDTVAARGSAAALRCKVGDAWQELTWHDYRDQVARVAGGLPAQVLSPFTDLGRQATNPQWQYPTAFNPKVNYTRTLGRHSVKTGLEYQHVRTEVQDVNPLYGRDEYQGRFSRPVGSTSTSGRSRMSP